MNKNNLQVELTAEEVQNLAGKPIPAPKELFKPLSNWHSVLYDAFYYALPRTRDMLKQTHCKQSIKWFKPQIIRFLVNDFLFDKEISAQLVDDNDEKQNDANYEPRVAYFGEIGHLFGLKTAGCPGKSATPIL